ncbi:MAG: rhomboid family intramembrane serine protease [Chitinophagaceae bacterium]
MGQRDYFEKKPTLGQNNNALVILFAINAFLFVILNFLKIVFLLDGLGEAAEQVFQKKILYWFTLSAKPSELLYKPWTLLTYMFSNYSIWGFVSNMLWLWAFGYVLQDLVGNKKLIPIYLFGGFFGGVFYVITTALFPSIQQSIYSGFLYEGSGAAVLAVAVATTILSPNYRIYQHIGSGFSLWILGLFFLAIDIASIAYSGNTAMLISHLTAGIIGFVYVKQLQAGKDWGSWIYNFAYWVDDLFNPGKKHQKVRQMDRVFYKAKEPVFSKTPNVTEKRVDELLDKISKLGYNRLTKEEKDFLDRAAKESD